MALDTQAVRKSAGAIDGPTKKQTRGPAARVTLTSVPVGTGFRENSSPPCRLSVSSSRVNALSRSATVFIASPGFARMFIVHPALASNAKWSASPCIPSRPHMATGEPGAAVACAGASLGSCSAESSW